MINTVVKLALLALIITFSIRFEMLRTAYSLPEELLYFSNFLIFIFSASLILRFLAFLYRKRKHLNDEKLDNVLIGLQNIYYILFVGAVMMTLLAFLGIDYKTLFTSLSIVAAAIAIISKDYLNEIISGIIISFSRELSIDDYIKIGEHKGKIVDINITKIALLNDDDDLVFIPNNKVFSSEIINYTKKQIQKVNIEFDIDLNALESIEVLEKNLIRCLKEYHESIVQNSFNLKVSKIQKDYISLKFQYVLHQVNMELEREIRKKTVRYVAGMTARKPSK
jgi:small-conductance mechanosensitive channel